MNRNLTIKMIQDRCGTVSFKRGETLLNKGKVQIEHTSPGEWNGMIKEGINQFYVRIHTDAQGDLLAGCSCPKLASYQKECQHIAAVLLGIKQPSDQSIQPEAKDRIHHPEHEADFSAELWKGFDEVLDRNESERLSEEVLELFGKQRPLPRKRLGHFDAREPLSMDFLCRLIDSGGTPAIAISMEFDGIQASNIEQLLFALDAGQSAKLPSGSIYDPQRHFFTEEEARILEELAAISSGGAQNGPFLFVPPASWERILPFLLASKAKIVIENSEEEKELAVLEPPLPISFLFARISGAGTRLVVEGMNNIRFIPGYSIAVSDGVFYKLQREEAERLASLIEMLKKARTNEIPVPASQLALFVKKVLPGLRQLGHVKLEGLDWRELDHAPLTAKIYLDRVKDRLLAGVEFHYGDIVLQPDETTSAFIVRDLEREQAIIDLMDSSSFTRTDGGFYLHNEELEYEFLYHRLPALERLASIYATTAVRNRVIRKASPPAIRVLYKRERTNWLDFSFDLSPVAGKEIKELLKAIVEKRKYYRLKRGSLMSLEAKEYEEIRRFLKAGPTLVEDEEALYRLPFLQGLREMDHFSTGVVEEESLRCFLASIKDPEEKPLPSGLLANLSPYQQRGFQWMKSLAEHGFGGILADDMGLGKTVQSIAYLVSELETMRSSRVKSLVVCPSSLIYNWASELKRFAPNVRAAVADGPPEVRKQKLLNGDTDVLITSYPLLRKDVDQYEKQQFHTVLFDEAQAFKNPMTRTARAAGKIKAANRFALTGTPIENSAEEIWSIFHVVFPGLFPNLKEFALLPPEKIARRISPFLLRRKKEDVLSQLPEKEEATAYSELLPEQKNLYAAYLAKLRHDTLKHLDKETFGKNRIRILAGITRLRQICADPRLFVEGYSGGSAKYQQFQHLIRDSIAAGRRVLVFSQWTKMLEIIKRDLAVEGADYFYLDGHTPSDQRLELCRRFNGGEGDIFLISLKAGGTGLNLTGADTVILYDLWWNPAVEEQAADRAHRIGQNKKVQVIKLVSKGTIEDKMNDLQARKRMLAEEIIDGESGMTDDDIQELLFSD